MASAQSTVKEKLSKTSQKSKSKIRELKNILNKPRNDYSEFVAGETFVLAQDGELLLKLSKYGQNMIYFVETDNTIADLRVTNLLTGLTAGEEDLSDGGVKLYQVSRDGKELCRLTIGSGLLANIKKSDISIKLETWVE